MARLGPTPRRTNGSGLIAWKLEDCARNWWFADRWLTFTFLVAVALLARLAGVGAQGFLLVLPDHLALETLATMLTGAAIVGYLAFRSMAPMKPPSQHIPVLDLLPIPPGLRFFLDGVDRGIGPGLMLGFLLPVPLGFLPYLQPDWLLWLPAIGGVLLLGPLIEGTRTVIQALTLDRLSLRTRSGLQGILVIGLIAWVFMWGLEESRLDSFFAVFLSDRTPWLDPRIPGLQTWTSIFRRIHTTPALLWGFPVAWPILMLRSIQASILGVALLLASNVVLALLGGRLVRRRVSRDKTAPPAEGPSRLSRFFSAVLPGRPDPLGLQEIDRWWRSPGPRTHLLTGLIVCWGFHKLQLAPAQAPGSTVPLGTPSWAIPFDLVPLLGFLLFAWSMVATQLTGTPEDREVLRTLPLSDARILGSTLPPAILCAFLTALPASVWFFRVHAGRSPGTLFLSGVIMGSMILVTGLLMSQVNHLVPTHASGWKGSRNELVRAVLVAMGGLPFILAVGVELNQARLAFLLLGLLFLGGFTQKAHGLLNAPRSPPPCRKGEDLLGDLVLGLPPLIALCAIPALFLDLSSPWDLAKVVRWFAFAHLSTFLVATLGLIHRRNSRHESLDLWAGTRLTALGGGLGIVTLLLACGYLYSTGLVPADLGLDAATPSSRVTWTMTHVLTAWVVGGLLAPLTEELVFRRLLFRGLVGATRRPLLAAGVSSFLFASLHPVIAFPVTFSFGLVACALFHRTGRLSPTVALHVVHNTGVLVILIGLGGAS